jgi:hypothetical protein
MDGYAGRGAATGTGAPLLATALALAPPSSADVAPAATVLVCCDLLCLSSDVLADVRTLLRERRSTPPRLLLSCSHTHTGPVSEGHPLLLIPGDAGSRVYLPGLIAALADVADAAVEGLAPARLSVARTEAAIGVNRRRPDVYGTVHMEPNPEGAHDPRVDVLRVDHRDGRPLAVLMNTACHAVSLGDVWREWNPDFPGVARDIVERETGATALFLQGAAGDVNTVLFGHDATHPQQVGTVLGAAVVEALSRTTALAPDPVAGRALSTTVLLPRLQPSTADEAEAKIAALEREREAIVADAPDDPKYLHWADIRLQTARAGRAALNSGSAPRTFSVELTAVALDRDTAIVTAPGEVFTELAQQIRAHSPFRHLFYAGYTNGSVYYIPTRAAYSEGGYEIESACFVAPEAGEILVAESVALLERLHRTA